MNYVFDTSAAEVLIETCRLQDALRFLSQTVTLVAPSKVRVEYLKGSRPERDIKAFDSLFNTADEPVDSELLPYFHFDSDCGEINVISYALHNDGYCCVIDEEYGRRICVLFQLPVKGSIGLIKELCRLGLVSGEERRTIRRQLRRSTFRISRELLREI
jgi:predicted nucleic acid-binding protein